MILFTIKLASTGEIAKVTSMMCLFIFRSGSSTCGARHLNRTNGCRCRSEYGDVLVAQVADENAFAETQIGYIDVDGAGKMLHIGAYAEFTLAEYELAPLFHTFGHTGQPYRNVDGNGFARNDMIEVDVQDFVADGVVLHFAHYTFFFFAFDVEFDKVRIGGEDQFLDLFFVYRKMNGFTVAIDHAGNHARFADTFASFFAEIITFRGGDFENFHDLDFVCSY